MGAESRNGIRKDCFRRGRLLNALVWSIVDDTDNLKERAMRGFWQIIESTELDRFSDRVILAKKPPCKLLVDHGYSLLPINIPVREQPASHQMESQRLEPAHSTHLIHSLPFL